MTKAGNEQATFRIVAQQLNHCVTAVHPNSPGRLNFVWWRLIFMDPQTVGNSEKVRGCLKNLCTPVPTYLSARAPVRSFTHPPTTHQSNCIKSKKC